MTAAAKLKAQDLCPHPDEKRQEVRGMGGGLIGHICGQCFRVFPLIPPPLPKPKERVKRPKISCEHKAAEPVRDRKRRILGHRCPECGLVLPAGEEKWRRLR